MKLSPRTLVALLGFGLLAWANADFLPARHLPCQQLHGRSQTICQTADKNMPFLLTGHAMFSPGWKPDFMTVKTVYCTLGISAKDQPALDEMSESKDWRARMVADALSALLDPSKAPGTIFDPTGGGPDYLLKDGCGPIKAQKQTQVPSAPAAAPLAAPAQSPSP